MRPRSISVLNFVTVVCVFVILASNSIAIIGAEYGYYAFIAWLLYALLSNGTILMKVLSQPFLKYSFIYCLLLLATSLIGSDILWGIKVSAAFLLMIFPAIIISYYLILNKSPQSICLLMTLLVGVLSLYGSYFGYLDDDFGRSVTSGDYEGTQMAFGGVAMASGAAVFSVFIISQMVNRAIKVNIALILLLLSQIALVITSGSTITTVCLFLFVLFCVIPNKHYNVLITTLVLFMFLCIVLHEQIGRLIIEFGNSLTNRTSSERFVSLGAAVAFGENTADSAYFFDRIDRPLLSLSTFFDNPIFGVAYKYGNNWDLAYKTGVGCHGEWADALARFGVFAFFYFKIFSSLLKQFKILSGKAWTYIWIVLGLVNPVVSFYSSLILFFIIPSWKLNRK